MSGRRSRRSAAAAAETAIARVVEDDSDDSTGSNFSADGTLSSEEETMSNGSDADFDVDLFRNKNKRANKTKIKSPVTTAAVLAPATIATFDSSKDHVQGEAISSSKQTDSLGSNGVSSVETSGTVSSASSDVSDTSNTQSSASTPAPTNENYEQKSDGALKSLLRSFRLTDLQALMIFVGKNKAGRKPDLLTRATNLLSVIDGETKKKYGQKIQELSASMYKSIGAAPSVNPYSQNYIGPAKDASTVSALPKTNPVPILPVPSTSSVNNCMADQISSTSTQRYDNNYPSYPYFNSPNSHLVYPTFPDVKMRNLPFFKIEAVLMRPSSLQPRGMARFQEQTFSFHLTPTQASYIAQSSYRDGLGRQDYKKQIQLRFGLLETSCDQDDNFPSSVCVKVNGRLQSLPNPIPTNKPGVEPKRPPKPINITGLCKLSSTVPNYVNVSWAVEVGSGYTVSVYFVDKLASTDLLDELKRKGRRHPDYTSALIKDKLSDKDSEIATTSCKVTLACPLGMMRMSLPCRASTCDHLQCFDANLYLMMNEKKPKWTCPVCNKPALYENLLIDGYFSDVLTSKRLPVDEHEIVLHNDASWDPLVPAKKADEDKKPKVEPGSPESEGVKVEPNVEMFSVDDDDDDDDVSNDNSKSATSKKPGMPALKPANAAVDCVTLDSDSDDDVVAPPQSKRLRLIDSVLNLIDDDNCESTNNLVYAGPTISPRPAANPMPVPASSSPPLICLDDDDDD